MTETRDAGSYVRRRRVCVSTACGHKVSTAEFPLPKARSAAGRDLVIVPRHTLQSLYAVASKLVELPPVPALDDEPTGEGTSQ
ncbi:MAG TPA: hypothetical protein VFD36_20700 [Kofleriaceae bacterium]|nr:hypothetical protein [Kofleriaceae bacterium]